MERTRRRSVLLLVGLVAGLLIAGGVAYGVHVFPDVADNDPHAAGIEWAAQNGIVQGYTNGNFGPYDEILRGQAATMFSRYEQYRMQPVEARRGCEDCHVPGGQFSLKNEAVTRGGPVHNGLPEDADMNTCLGCHARDADGTGNVAPIALIDVVHPAHMYSKIFAWRFMGNCFSCHNVDPMGQFDVLPKAVATDESGIPDTVPIPTQQDPVRPGAVTTTTVPVTTTTLPVTTTTIGDTTTTTTGG
jgi:hypothetical protein